MSEDALSLLLARLESIERKVDELLRDQHLPKQEWLSIDEVATVTGLSADHVRRHVTSGILPVCNQGTFEKPYYRIHRKDVDEWMAKRREAPAPAPRKKKARAKYASRHHQKNS